jgi:manganese transport protein
VSFYHPDIRYPILTTSSLCSLDVAEVLGSAIALKLLFGLPLVAGVCVTACDVLIVLFLNGSRYQWIERFVILLIIIILICFTIQLVYCKPDATSLFLGFVPKGDLFTDGGMLYVAVGIIGATVMPHNLFLHSSIILTRKIPRSNNNNGGDSNSRSDDVAVGEALKFGAIDSVFSLTIAFLINAAILIVSAATFYQHSYHDVATLEDAYQLFQPILHSKVAPIIFGIALLASGQNSTLTGTLTGQIIMEGFLQTKIAPSVRRIITRLLAIIPSVLVIVIGGESQANSLLLFSQVILSFALPFAVIPLLHITSSVSRMGKQFVNSCWLNVVCCMITVILITLNFILLIA